MIALAMVLLLAAGQAAGCASFGTEDENVGGQPLGPSTDVLIAGFTILSVIAAVMATSSAGD